MPRRWMILVVGLPLYAFVLMLLVTIVVGMLVATDWSDLAPARFFGNLHEIVLEPGWWAYVGTIVPVMVLLQAVFLVPVMKRRPPREQRSRSLLVSLVVGGLVAGVLTGVLGAAVSDLLALVVAPLARPEDKPEWLWLIPVVALVGGWAVWTLLLVLFVRDIWADRVLGRLVGLLLAGTLVEMLVILPLDVMIRRRTECYCATGTFLALSVAAVTCIWLAGPGAFIAVAARRHRLWRESHCDRCGYPRGPAPGPACPECGQPWDGAAALRRSDRA